MTLTAELTLLDKALNEPWSGVIMLCGHDAANEMLRRGIQARIDELHGQMNLRCLKGCPRVDDECDWAGHPISTGWRLRQEAAKLDTADTDCGCISCDAEQRLARQQASQEACV